MEKTPLLLFILLIILISGCSNESNITGATTALTSVEPIEEEIIDEPIEEEKENITTVRLCHDTDNGIVRWVKGKIFGFYDNATRFEFNDYCQNFNYLWEFYCEEENPKQQIFLCTNGCEDDHCL
ncbi:hypothetical protein CMO93_05355 [Candidatus Woesearchaeota archaeon]|nr:hypothetical protein [Candidatus Woesearchaeota archaeon]|tara:strand:- start:840 stop:1214 length:375 start_codon:yes stop_codon:yes gene_type:complete